MRDERHRLGICQSRSLPVAASRNVRLFRNGRNQAVRIPREFEMPGEEALIYREGRRLVIEPVERPSIARLLAGWGPLDVEWPEFDDPRSEPVDLDKS